MKSRLNEFATSELTEDSLSEVHGGRRGGNQGSLSLSGSKGPSIVIAPVVNVAVAINIATQIGGSNAILQSINIGQFLT